MLKRIASLLLVLLVMFTGTAFAEEKMTAQVTLSVLDENGQAFVGANVTLLDAYNTVIEELVYEDNVTFELT